ncbi:MAG: (deoxy)nucleoside triphosphate pyrophosphohydrolase [Fibrobacterales bacterium]
MVPVTCAVLFDNRKILTVKRGNAMKMAGYWEFPGGKVEADESHTASLQREIMEELGIEISVEYPLTPVEWHYVGGPHITLYPFVCKVFDGFLDRILLYEHEELRWLSVSDLWSIEWADADVPIVKEVEALLATIE